MCDAVRIVLVVRPTSHSWISWGRHVAYDEHSLDCPGGCCESVSGECVGQVGGAAGTI